MKPLTIRLADEVMSELEKDAETRNTTVSNVVRECIAGYQAKRKKPADTMSLIEDLVGSVGDLPQDMSVNTKQYLKKSGYGSSAR